MEQRFRVILANGEEVVYAGVADLVAAFRAGQFTPSSLLFDERVGRWTPAIEHDAIVASMVQGGASVPPAAPKPPVPELVTPALTADLRSPGDARPAAAAPPELDPRLDPSLAKLRGVGGWLAWFEGCCFGTAFLLIIDVVPSFTTSGAAGWESLSVYSPSAGFVQTFENGGEIAVAALSLGLGLFLALRRRESALLAVTVLLAALIFSFADLLLSGIVFGELREAFRSAGQTMPYALQQAEQSGYGAIGRAMAACLAWLLYLFKSKRVRATFGPVTWQRVKLALVGHLPPAPAAAGRAGREA